MANVSGDHIPAGRVPEFLADYNHYTPEDLSYMGAKFISILGISRLP
jgi:hypothetical protein